MLNGLHESSSDKDGEVHVSRGLYMPKGWADKRNTLDPLSPQNPAPKPDRQPYMLNLNFSRILTRLCGRRRLKALGR